MTLVNMASEKWLGSRYTAWNKCRSVTIFHHLCDLNVGTIMSHLERWVDAGKIAFEQVVDAEHYRRIKTYYEQHPEAKKQPLSEVRREIGDDIYYAEINLTLNKLKK